MIKKVAIVTVDFNGHKDTSEFLESAKKLDTEGIETLWLVVDNGSDESVGPAVEKFAGVTWIQTGRNLGFAGGYNRGMKYAREWGADFVLIINNDTLFPDKNLLKKLLLVFQNNSEAGLVSPKIYFAPEFEFYKEKYTKNDMGKVIWYAGGSFDWNNVRSVHKGIDEVDRGQFDKTEKTEIASGACVLVKREILETVGYFDEKLFAYYEDSDWNERIKQSGFEIWYTGSTYIYHKVSRTAGIGSSWSDYMISRNRLWFGMKYASFKTKFALLREIIKLLIIGRPAQKDGIIDYFRGVWGWKNSKQSGLINYPLEVSIVIVNYNTNELTEKAIKSVYNNPPKVNFEIIVADNGSEEKFKTKQKIKLIENNENLGFAKANNQGIRFSRGKYILLLNSDAEVKRGTIDKMYQFGESHKDAGVVSAKLLNPDGSVQGSVFKLPTLWRTLTGQTGKFVPIGNNSQKVEAPSMAAFLITPKTIEKVGLLNEKYFMYFEDLDYCRSILRSGLSIYYLPDAEVIHYHGASGENLANTENQWRRLIPGSKIYHGIFNHYLISFILWIGQKLRNGI